MIEAQYKRENHKSYLVLQNDSHNHMSPEDDMEISSVISMICTNPMEGILDVTEHIFNGEEELYYDISSMQPLNILYEKKLFGKKDLEMIFQGIKKAIDSIENYLVDPEYLVIAPEYIYIDLSERKIKLLLCPFYSQDSEKMSAAFAEYILEKIQNDDNETVMYAYNFYRLVKEEQGDLFVAINRLLKEKTDFKITEGMDTSFQDSPISTKSSESYSEDVFHADQEYSFDDSDIPMSQFTDGAQSDHKAFRNSTDKEDHKQHTNAVNLSFEKKLLYIFLIMGIIGIAGSAYYFNIYNLSIQQFLFQKEALVFLGIALASVVGIAILGLRNFIVKKRSNSKDVVDVHSKTYNTTADEFILDETFANENRMTTNENRMNKYENRMSINASDRSGTNANIRFEEMEIDSDNPYRSASSEENCKTVLIADQAYHEDRILVGKIKGRKKEIDLSSFPFFVGKATENVDYTIPDASVSRIHAKFSLRDDLVYLTDLNSTNSTYKNGIKLQPNEMALLEAGDEITFGKVSFTYQ